MFDLAMNFNYEFSYAYFIEERETKNPSLLRSE